MKSLFISGLMILVVRNFSYSQMPTFSCSSGNTYTAIQGLPLFDEILTVQLGFTFTYTGFGYDRVTICRNGFVAMGLTSSCPFFNDLCTTNLGLHRIICGFWDDLFPQIDRIQFAFLGSAPNRVFVTQWDSVPFFSGIGGVTFQIRLYETTNIIEIIYGPGVNYSSASGSIGLNNYPGGSGHVMSILPGSTCANTIVSTTVCYNDVPYTNLTSGLKYTFTPVVGIKSETSETPAEFDLLQNYPNPFNPKTEIKFRIAKSSFVMMKVYDILGKQVATLVSQKLTPGTYSVDFSVSEYPSGVYTYKLEADGNTIHTKKMVLLK